MYQDLSKLPLPLGEGWGEGVAEYLEKKTLLHLFPARPYKTGRERSVLGFVARPSPRPSPKGRGSYLRILLTLLTGAVSLKRILDLKLNTPARRDRINRLSEILCT